MLYRRVADGSGTDETVVSSQLNQTTPHWSPVDDVLLYTANADVRAEAGAQASG